jgi:Carboxypeptidase regulatory-like domain
MSNLWGCLRRVSALLLAGGLSAISVVNAQGTGRLEGHVIDPQQRPIASATVSVVGSGLSTSTGSDGSYTLLNVPAGTISVRAARVGYRPHQTDSLRMTAGRVVTQDFALERMGSEQPAEPIPLLFRFQLIEATDSRSVDPAIASIDTVLKDLFKFPGYRLVTAAAMAADYFGPAGTSGCCTYTRQLLNADGQRYALWVSVISATKTDVRMEVSLRTAYGNGDSGNETTLLDTRVGLSYGHTVVLGSTQPRMTGASNGLGQTLILAVEPELRQ